VQSLLILKIFKHVWGAFLWTQCSVIAKFLPKPQDGTDLRFCTSEPHSPQPALYQCSHNLCNGVASLFAARGRFHICHP